MFLDQSILDSSTSTEYLYADEVPEEADDDGEEEEEEEEEEEDEGEQEGGSSALEGSESLSEGRGLRGVRAPSRRDVLAGGRGRERLQQLQRQRSRDDARCDEDEDDDEDGDENGLAGSKASPEITVS